MIFSNGERITTELFRNAALKSNQRRKDDARRKLDYYENLQEQHILDQLRGFYVKNLERITPVSVNIVRKIINALSTTYIQDAVRLVDGTEQDQQIYASIEDSASLPVRMKQASRYTKLLGNVLLRPVWRGGGLDLDVLTPDLLDVFCGDSPENILAVLVTKFSDSAKENEIEYVLWTPEQVQRLNYNFKIISQEENPYGVLPFVAAFASAPVSDFWLPGANDLMLTQAAVNKRLSDLWHTLDFQSSGVFFMSGVKKPAGRPGAAPWHTDYHGTITIGPGSVLYLPEDGKIGFAHPEAPVTETLSAIDHLLKWAAITNGLPAGSMSLEPTEQSGISRIVANSELSEMRADDIAMFARVEQQLFQIIRTVWNVHNPGRQISEAATMRTDFYDPQPSTSAVDQLREWQGLLELGLISQTDILIERNPDLSRDDAKAELVRIQDENKEFQQSTFG